MKNRFRAGTGIIAGIYLFIGYCIPAPAQTQSHVPNTAPKETIMTTRASGTFEVKLTPQADDDPSEDPSLGRMSIDKQFHGDLEAISKGQMLTAITAIKGSAGYVAIERVTGTLHGLSGTFVLQHSGTMTRGAQKLTVSVVPDSGTGQLIGLAGEMIINVSEGKHSYDFEYTLTPAP
ncbi:MAG: DUF3224 domain-containing protein [bacterium]